MMNGGGHVHDGGRRLAAVMAEALASHWPGASRVEEAAVAVGPGGEVARCAVFPHNPPIVQLSLRLEGGAFGDAQVADDWASFGDSPEQAVVQGVHDWVSHNGQAVAKALSADRSTPPFWLHNTPFSAIEGEPQLRATRPVDALSRAIGQRSVVQRVIDSGALPILSPGRAHLLVCFAAQSGGSPTLEVKIDGQLWPAAHAALEPLLREASAGPGDYVSFRQLAVLRPGPQASQVRPSLDSLIHSLRGLAQADSGLSVFGARAHRWQPRPPIDARALAEIEARGIVLPPGYRELVTQAYSSGPGPGYGLLPPHTPPQLATLRGPFPHVNAWKPPPGPDAAGDACVRGTLPLAHLGCGYIAMLVVDGPAYGQVWADLRPAGEGLVPTHASFVDWMFDWIDSSVSGRMPKMPLKPGLCALPNALSNYFHSIEQKQGHVDARAAVDELPDGAIQTRTDGTDRCFDQNDPIDLCPLCEGLRLNLGIRPEVFVPGVPPKALRALGR